MTPDTLNLVDPQTFLDNDMPSFWRRIRAEQPVFRHEAVDGRPGFWVVSTHRDATAVYRDNVRFTTESGNMLLTLLNGGDPAGGRMVSVSDGHRHKDLRVAILKAFSARALEHVADRIYRYTHELVAEAAGVGGCDFAEDVAARVPMNTVCDLLGIPATDRTHLLALNKQAVSADDPDQTNLDGRLARNEIVLYLSELVRARRENPGDDAISVLVGADMGDGGLSDQDIVLNSYSLLLGGDETSRFSMISAVDAFASHRDQWARLRNGEVDLRTATEEVVRWATPIMHVGRTARAPADLDGARIEAGDIVTLWNSSANRDENAFSGPDTFDLGRTPNRHLAFGTGSHYCVGVYLARAEIGALLEALRTHVADIEPSAPALPIYSNVLTGYRSLPVTFVPQHRRER